MRGKKPRLDGLEQITGRYVDVNDSASKMQNKVWSTVGKNLYHS